MIVHVDTCKIDFVHLKQVTESSPDSIIEENFVPLHADIEHINGEPVVCITVRKKNVLRPGYGIIYGKRRNFLSLGGYKRLGQGTWGWEDMDFIIRLNLCSFTLMSAGYAKHLTHSNRYRSLNNMDKAQSRNANARQSLCEIAWGQLMGDMGNRQKRTNTIPKFYFQQGIDQILNIQGTATQHIVLIKRHEINF